MAQTYQYKGVFSIEDCPSGKIQQWFNGKIYEEKDIFVSSKRLKTLINLGYLKPIADKKGVVQKSR